MALHRQHPAPQMRLSASRVVPVLPVASTNYPRSSDMTVCEWTADLSATPLLDRALGQITVGAVGYVDFDVLDSARMTARL